jgi:hypothetical protein
VTLPSSTDGYTASVTGSTQGTTWAEIYDATGVGSATAPRLINGSVRTYMDAAGGKLIAGFAIGGGTSKTVLIRAIGPGLAQFGVSAALNSPQLTLYTAIDGSNVSVATNAGGAGDAPIVAIARAVGAFPLSIATSDAAILRSLSPGAYTVSVEGGRNDPGVVLLEIYEVP